MRNSKTVLRLKVAKNELVSSFEINVNFGWDDAFLTTIIDNILNH